MEIGRWRSGRGPRALAGLLALAAACAGCSGASHAPRPAATPHSALATAVTANPCILVSQAQAGKLLGTAVLAPLSGRTSPASCIYETGNGPSVIVSYGQGLGTVSALAAQELTRAVTEPGVNRQARCGRASKTRAIFGLLTSVPHLPGVLYVLSASCAVDAGFARQAGASLRAPGGLAGLVPAASGGASACPLVSQAQAARILGTAVLAPRPGISSTPSCVYETDAGTLVTVTYEKAAGSHSSPAALLTALAARVLVGPVPEPGAGAQAQCGRASGSTTLSGLVSLLPPAVPGVLLVFGPSCDIDAQFARQADAMF